jgi:hypothetical protein
MSILNINGEDTQTRKVVAAVETTALRWLAYTAIPAIVIVLFWVVKLYASSLSDDYQAQKDQQAVIQGRVEAHDRDIADIKEFLKEYRKDRWRDRALSRAIAKKLGVEIPAEEK